MIGYGILAFKGLNGPHSGLLPYFIFGGIVIVIMGYWLKKAMGAFVALLSVLFLYFYIIGSFNHITW